MYIFCTAGAPYLRIPGDHRLQNIMQQLETLRYMLLGVYIGTVPVEGNLTVSIKISN